MEEKSGSQQREKEEAENKEAKLKEKKFTIPQAFNLSEQKPK